MLFTDENSKNWKKTHSSNEYETDEMHKVNELKAMKT